MTAELVDSTILIDYLNGIPGAARAVRPDSSMSIISWIEVLAGTRTDTDESIARAFLARLDVLDLSHAVAEEAVRVRRERRLKLPDAMIWATARVYALTLVTRNTKDFPANDPFVRVPYTL